METGHWRYYTLQQPTLDDTVYMKWYKVAFGYFTNWELLSNEGKVFCSRKQREPLMGTHDWQASTDYYYKNV